MFVKRSLLCLALVVLCVRPAIAKCPAVNANVQRYVSTHSDWSIVEINDLSDDDKKLWERYHSGDCPGVAAVNLDGRGISYAIALIHKSSAARLEKLILLRKTGQKMEQLSIRGESKITFPLVVWRAKPGNFIDQATGRSVRIRHDSIIYEKMESTSTQFYVTAGRLQSLLASD